MQSNQKYFNLIAEEEEIKPFINQFLPEVILLLINVENWTSRGFFFTLKTFVGQFLIIKQLFWELYLLTYYHPSSSQQTQSEKDNMFLGN